MGTHEAIFARLRAKGHAVGMTYVRRSATAEQLHVIVDGLAMPIALVYALERGHVTVSEIASRLADVDD